MSQTIDRSEAPLRAKRPPQGHEHRIVDGAMALEAYECVLRYRDLANSARACEALQSNQFQQNNHRQRADAYDEVAREWEAYLRVWLVHSRDVVNM